MPSICKKKASSEAIGEVLLASFIIVCLFGSIVWLIFKGLGLVQSGDLAIGELFNFMFLTAFVGGSIGGMAEQFVQIQKNPWSHRTCSRYH